jgi:hypothetical protein
MERNLLSVEMEEMEVTMAAMATTVEMGGDGSDGEEGGSIDVPNNMAKYNIFHYTVGPIENAYVNQPRVRS